MAKPLRIALTKGRLEKDTVGLLERLGYDCTAVREKGRRLILPIPDGNMEVVLAKANDVITYVEHGVCDMGVVGKDTIIEMQGKFFELVDLGFGRCKFALACKKGTDFYSGFGVKCIATKYPNVARRFFESKGHGRRHRQDRRLCGTCAAAGTGRRHRRYRRNRRNAP